MISERDFHRAVGDRLKKLRLGYGVSQLTFAEKLGVGASAISNYEAGTRAVDPYDAHKLKGVYNAPLEWLYCGDESTIAPHVLEKINNPPKRRGVSEAKTGGPRHGARATKRRPGR